MTIICIWKNTDLSQTLQIWSANVGINAEFKS